MRRMKMLVHLHKSIGSLNLPLVAGTLQIFEKHHFDVVNAGAGFEELTPHFSGDDDVNMLMLCDGFNFFVLEIAEIKTLLKR